MYNQAAAGETFEQAMEWLDTEGETQDSDGLDTSHHHIQGWQNTWIDQVKSVAYFAAFYAKDATEEE